MEVCANTPKRGQESEMLIELLWSRDSAAPGGVGGKTRREVSGCEEDRQEETGKFPYSWQFRLKKQRQIQAFPSRPSLRG